MQSRITSRGIDCTGIIDGPYRFAEIICRDDGGLRYDVPLPWLGDDGESCRNVEEKTQQQQRQQVGSERVGAPLSNLEKNGVVDLHMEIDQIVPPVLEALWSRDDDNSSNIDDKNVNSSSNTRSSSSYVAAAGFLINEPGSKAQNWHKDGPDPGFINCFVPLIDLTEELGPTAFSLAIDGSNNNIDYEDDENDDRKNVLVPMLNMGNILLFDYRTLHRGQGNTSNDDITRTLAYAVYCRRRTRRRTSPIDDDEVKESGDVHNFPAALTLEYD
jgi:ectoine hydroxylase-related dioxygenase (phytanoyl-CoA dioxygenase family)